MEKMYFVSEAMISFMEQYTTIYFHTFTISHHCNKKYDNKNIITIQPIQPVETLSSKSIGLYPYAVS